MKCPKCGNEVAEGLTACERCGEAIATEAAAPAVTVTPAAPAAPQPKVGKMKYLASVAPTKVRVVAILVWVVALLTLVALGGSYYGVINANYDEIPIVSAVLPVMLPEEFTDLTDEYEDALGEAIDELEGYIDEMEGMTDAQEEALSGLLDTANELKDNISINNIDEIVSELESVMQMEFGEIESSEILGAFDLAKTVSFVLDFLKMALLCVVVFCGIWIFLGGLFRWRWSIITGMVFTLLYSLPLCSAVYTVGLLVLNIALIVLTSITTSSYKKYRKS